MKILHEKKIFHRDLKSANVFLCKDGTAKIGDMNVSKIAKRGLLYTQTGTPYYASPEVWNDKPYDSKSDIWSLGCVIYEMASLKPPFRAEDMEGLYKRVTKGVFKKLPSHFSVDLNNFVKLMLRVNPNQRPSADKLLKLPMITKRVNKICMVEPEVLNNDMLKTIRLPGNLHYLTDRLPKANYDPIKTKVSSDFSGTGIKKMTMPELKNNMDKLGEESKSQFLKEIKKEKIKEGSHLSKSPKLVNSESKISQEDLKQVKLGRRAIGKKKGGQRSGSPKRRPHQGNALSSEILLKKEHDKMEAQIKRYNSILNNHKSKKKQMKGSGNQIKRKIEMILGRDRPGIVRGKNSMQIYGKGINYSNVSKSLKLKPIVSRKKLGGKRSKKGRIGVGKVYKLPRLY